MRPRLTTLLMLAATGISGSAWAQTDFVQVDQPTLVIGPGNSSAFNQAACLSTEGGTLVVYDFPSGVTSGTKLAIYATEKNTCPETPPEDAEFLLAKSPVNVASPSGSEKVNAIDLVPDCPANTTLDFTICATTWTLQQNVNTGAVEEKVFLTASIIVTYDSLQPTTPVVTSLVPGDGSVTLTWTAQNDIDRWIVYYRTIGEPPPGDGDICNEVSSSGSAQTQCWWQEGADACIITSCDNSSDAGCIIPADADLPAEPADAGSPDVGEPADAALAWDASPAFDGTGYQSQTFESGTTSLTTGKVSGLVNNQRYEFRLVAVDLAENVSAGSTPAFETPLTVHDFYRRFQCAGGQEKGGFGCSTTGVALLFPVAGLAVLALIRRRRAA